MADRKLGVVIVADASKFISGLKNAGRQVQGLRGQIDELDVTVKGSAETQVAAAVKSQARLREQAAAYRQIGAAAEKGSREQIAASNLATEAERRLSTSLGVSAREARGFAASASRAESEAGRVGRGAIAGSGAFRSLGRSVAFASSWFLGGVGLTAAFKGSIDAASTLDEQMQRTDTVFGSSAGAVKAWSKTSGTAFGLARSTALDAADTVGTLLENVGETPKAASGMSQAIVKLASDMAAFKKVKPEVALAALESGLQGRTRSLKQFGLVIDNTSIKAQAIASGILKSNVDPSKVHDDLSRVSLATADLGTATKKHGANSEQAARATLVLHNAQRQLAQDMAGTTGQLTSQQKALATYQLIMAQTTAQRGAFARDSGQLAIREQVFHAALQNTEAAIGQALLPTVNRYVGSLGTWLSSSQHQAEIQHDVGVATHYFSEALSGAVTLVRDAKGLFDGLASAVGGSKNAIELIGGSLVAWKIGSRLLSIASSANKLRLALVALSGTRLKLPNIPGAPKGSGKGGGTAVAEGATEDAVGLTLGTASAVAAAYAAPLVIAGLLSTKPKHIGSTLPGGQGSQIALMPDGSTVIVGPKGTVAYNGSFYPDGSKQATTTQDLEKAIQDRKHPTSTGLVVPRQTGTESNARKAAAAGVAASAAARRAAPKKIAPTTPVSYKTPTTRPTTYTDTATKPAATKDLAAIPISLQIAAARAATTSITTDDVRVAREIKAFEQAAIKSRKLTGEQIVEAYNTIAQQNSIIGTQTKAAAGRLVSSRELTAGIKFGSLADRKREEERIAQAIAHGGHRPTGHTVLGQKVDLHVHVAVDGTPMYEKTITHAQRQSRHHVTLTRGPNAGRGHPFN